ncbi:MAG: SCP2 sterol-binding domain-containing protein [Sciscionella sp.]|nr:SCP2 sterol-binding domain-containing protein [Sciscionella sp.]
MRTDALLSLLGKASTEQLDAVVAQPVLCELLLGELRERIPKRLRVESAYGINVTVHLRLLPFTDAEVVHAFYLTVRDARCTISDATAAYADVVITATVVDFLKVISSRMTAVLLLAQGRISVRGDYRDALRVLRCFDLA